MKKFFILVRKEVKELLTPQMLLPLVLIVLVFMFVGKLVGRESQKEATLGQPVLVEDLDKTDTSKLILAVLQKSNMKVEERTASPDELLREAREKNIKAVMVIPQGLEASTRAGHPEKVTVYTVMNNFSFTGSRSYQTVAAALAAVNSAVSTQLIAAQGTALGPEQLKNPIQPKDVVVVGNRQAEISPVVVSGFISTQTTLIPIILFLVITMSSQLIALSMAAEKENKTLETLLSAPVSRNAVVGAKLVGAGLVALLNAVVYLFGMRYYVNGLSGGQTIQSADSSVVSAVHSLGLAFSAQDYLLLGAMLFLAILVALSIAVLLGSFAEDAKSVQGLITPLMGLVLVPYFLTLFLDISSLSPVLRWFVYAIPFSHAFLTAPNLMLGRYVPVLWGMGYLLIAFVVFVVIAAKIFASDKILTMKLSFGKKKF